MSNPLKHSKLLQDLSPKLTEMLLHRNLNAERYRCHINNTPDLLLDVSYQDDIVATTFIRMSGTDLGYAKIDVFQNDRYIGHTGVVIHFNPDELSDFDDYGKAALPSITTAVEQLLPIKQTTREFSMEKKYPKQLTVKEVIEVLQKVENQNLPVAIWINSQLPEPVYSGCDRIPAVHVDTTVEGVINICCEAPAIKPTME